MSFVDFLRPETEAYSSHLADWLRQDDSPIGVARSAGVGSRMRILDLCTGTGCIPLLLHSLLATSFSQLEILGVDISSQALQLAHKNKSYNLKNGRLLPQAAKQISFTSADVLDAKVSSTITGSGSWDVVISNPPYISSAGFNKDTSRSVRNWEPRLALVPPVTKRPSGVQADDIFYPRILDIAAQGDARIAVMEVADTSQALRVAGYAVDQTRWKSVEIWRDWPDHEEEGHVNKGEKVVVVNEKEITLRGCGHGRSVVCWV